MSKFILDNSLKGKHKAFDNVLFEKYDIPARKIIKDALKDFIEDNPNIYEQDFIIKEPGFKFKYLEIQVCASWVNDTYPFHKVFIYERKYRYNEDTLFITLNKNLTKGFVFEAASFKNEKPRRLKKYSREFVYDIPWNKIMPITMDDFDIDILKLF